jgi:hypothetical protein
VNLLDQAVEHANAMATLQTCTGNVTSDKACTAGNEDGIRHEMTPDLLSIHRANEQNGRIPAP